MGPNGPKTQQIYVLAMCMGWGAQVAFFYNHFLQQLVGTWKIAPNRIRPQKKDSNYSVKKVLHNNAPNLIRAQVQVPFFTEYSESFFWGCLLEPDQMISLLFLQETGACILGQCKTHGKKAQISQLLLTTATFFGPKLEWV